MNGSLWSADRNTHLKIVLLAVLAVAVVVGVGFGAQGTDPNAAVTAAKANGPILRAERRTNFTANPAATVR